MAKKKDDGYQMSLNEYRLNEVSVRLVMHESSSLYSGTPIKSPEDGVEVMKDLLSQMDREMVCIINMDNKLRPINYNVVSIGALDSSIVPMTNCFKTAIMSNAAAVMLFHNHPTGDVTPSDEDKHVTERIIAAGQILGIKVIDHVIVGAYQGNTYSFRTVSPHLFDSYKSTKELAEKAMEVKEEEYDI